MCLGLEQLGLDQDHFMGQACYTGWMDLVDLYALQFGQRGWLEDQIVLKFYGWLLDQMGCRLEQLGWYF